MIARAFRYKLLCAAALTPIAALPSAAAPAPLVDTSSASPVTSVTREQLEKLPVGRRVEDLIRTCPSNTIPTLSRPPDVLIDGKPAVDLNCVQPADLDMIEVLKVHNGVRAEYGAPPLVWSPVLVQSATAIAEERARTGKREHSSRAGRGTVRENISQGLPWWSTRQLLENWTKEKKNFVPGIFPNVSRTNNWYDIGHWAQMIWIQTEMIGCARAAGIGSSWLVCHYDPGGNKDGKPVGIPVQTQQVASAPNNWIRPRLTGGDYTGGNKDGKAVDTSDGADIPSYNYIPSVYIPSVDYIPSVNFAVGPARVGLDVNACSGLGDTIPTICDKPAGAVDRYASTNVIIDVLFKGEAQAADTDYVGIQVEQPKMAPENKPTAYQWIDVKTGKPVASVPISGVNINGSEGAGVAIVSEDRRTAFNPRTGQNFAREPDGSWIDVKSGKPVASVPISGVNINGSEGAGVAIVSEDRRTAFNPRTGQNFAREPVPPK